MKIHKFRPTKKKDTLLFKLLFLVAGLHVAALLILGGMVISEIILQEEVAFEAPPPPEKVEKKKTFQHKVQPQQQSASKLIKRIQLPQAKTSNVSAANIALPSSDIAGTSLTGGLAPKGLGELKVVMTSVNLLGVKAKTEKIVIVIDASRYMMTDAKGALNTYNVIKNDIKKLINSLPPTVLFNVIAFSIPVPPKDGISVNAFNPSGLITASEDNKAKLMTWLDPINDSLSNLEVKGNYKLKLPFLPQAPDSSNRDKGGYDTKVSRLYIPYQAAIEQGADTIYFLTAGWTAPNAVKKAWTQAEKDAYAKKVAKARAAFEAKVKAANENVTEEQKKAKAEKEKEQRAERAKANAEALAKAKAWIAAENAKRKKAGQSLFVGTPDQVARKEGYYTRVAVSRGPVFTPPPQGDNTPYTGTEIVKYYKDLMSKQKGSPAETPILNMILFRGKTEKIDSQAKIAEAWCGLHKGQVKVLVGTEL